MPATEDTVLGTEGSLGYRGGVALDAGLLTILLQVLLLMCVLILSDEVSLLV